MSVNFSWQEKYLKEIQVFDDVSAQNDLESKSKSCKYEPDIRYSLTLKGQMLKI